MPIALITPIINSNMTKISVEEVFKLAKLSHLELNQEEAEKFAKEMESILNYAQQLQSVDADGLEPTSQVTGLVNVDRQDELDDYAVSADDLLEITPSTEDRYIKVKRVL